MLYEVLEIRGNDRTDQGLSFPVGIKRFDPYVLEINGNTLYHIYIRIKSSTVILHTQFIRTEYAGSKLTFSLWYSGQSIFK